MERLGILVVSRRGVNVIFWFRLGFSGQNGATFSGQGVF